MAFKPQTPRRGRPANVPASEIGQRVKRRMEALGIETNSELGQRLKDRHPNLGWHPFQISRLIAGQMPTVERAAALADVLECNAGWLISGEGAETPEPEMSRLGVQITDAMSMLGIPNLKDLSRISQIPQSELETAVRSGRAKPSTLTTLAGVLDLSHESLSVHAYSARPNGSVPLLGRVAAGSPILAEENFDGWVDVSQLVAHGDGMFALRVQGESMVEAGLQNGDIAFVRAQPEVPNGDMAVVIIGDEATVKFLFDAGDAWLLEPANRDMKPITVPKARKDVRVAGKVTGWMHQR